MDQKNHLRTQLQTEWPDDAKSTSISLMRISEIVGVLLGWGVLMFGGLMYANIIQFVAR